MAKRKREPTAATAVITAMACSDPPTTVESTASVAHLQIVTGTYEKTLHGFIASIPTRLSSTNPTDSATDTNTGADASSIALPTTFVDSFLFTAHTAPINALTLTPPTSSRAFLATASADENINLYTLTTVLPAASANTAVARTPTVRNKHLGTLQSHSNTPTTLVFTPTRSKLITGGLDSKIHIHQARSWEILSTLSVPIPKPKPVNYASNHGDGYGPRIPTFGTGADQGSTGLGGIKDLALHPSQKILLSISANERVVRMWNMMTARKAGTLALPTSVVPRIFGPEPIRVRWNTTGEDYAVAFERGVVVFGIDSRVRVKISLKTKVHMIRYWKVELPGVFGGTVEALVISTEDGRILFYDTKTPASSGDVSKREEPKEAVLLATLGGRRLGMPIRIKDFIILPANGRVFVITGSSDGIVRVWDLCGKGSSGIEVNENAEISTTKRAKVQDGDRQVGILVGVYETGRRITCIGGMVMKEGEPEDQNMGDVDEHGEMDDDTDDDTDETN